jgi:hypothetical protein
MNTISAVSPTLIPMVLMRNNANCLSTPMMFNRGLKIRLKTRIKLKNKKAPL